MRILSFERDQGYPSLGTVSGLCVYLKLRDCLLLPPIHLLFFLLCPLKVLAIYDPILLPLALGSHISKKRALVLM